MQFERLEHDWLTFGNDRINHLNLKTPGSIDYTRHSDSMSTYVIAPKSGL